MVLVMEGFLPYTVHALLAPQCVKLITKSVYIHDHFEDQVVYTHADGKHVDHIFICIYHLPVLIFKV